jgi:phosphoglycolate phosphatase-like HAD superfamily hydrolase
LAALDGEIARQKTIKLEGFMIRNIIWDVDGTLFDTYPSIAKAIKAAFNDLRQDAPLDWIENLAKVSLSHCGAVLADKCRLGPDDIDRAFEKRYASVTAEECPPFPGVIELCRYINSIEGKNVIVTHRGRKGTLELLATHNMSEYFAGCLTRDDGYPRKPDPAIFEAAIATYQLKRDETLTVGDREIP